MSLRLVYGRAGSGKTRFCLDGIKGSLHKYDSKPLILIVPEQFSLQGERNLLKALGSEGIFHAEVLSFRRMAYRVFNEVGGTARRHLNNAGKSMVLSRIVNDLKDKLHVFSNAAEQKGFAGTMAKMIAEFKRYDISAEKLHEMSAEVESGALKYKLEDLYLIYSKFESALGQRYLDSDDDLTKLYEKLDKSTQFNDAEIWIDEFSGFTPQEFKVIQKLLVMAQRVTVCLCADCLEDEKGAEQRLIFTHVRNTAEKLKRLAKNLNVAVEPSVVLGRNDKSDGAGAGRFGTSAELKHLEQNLFLYPFCKYQGSSGCISVFAAANIFTEAEAAAREIIMLCREKGMRYRDIALTCRDLDRYEKVVSVILKEYGIPYFIDKKREVTGHPLVVLILSAIEIFKSNWSHEAVFRYLKSGLANLENEMTDLLENFVLAHGVRGNRWMKEEIWSWDAMEGYVFSVADRYELQNAENIRNAREALTLPLFAFRAKTKGRKTAVEICTALYELLVEVGVPQRMEALIQSFQTSGELERANEYRQVWNIVMEVFTQVVEVAGEEFLTLSRFSEILSSGFEEYNIGLIPPALDQVLVGSVERSKSHEIKALFILGVNEGVFPAAMNEEGILTDAERAVLGALGAELAKDSKSRLIDERFLAYSALASPSEFLRLSYPAADRDGRALRQSRLISDIKRIFPDISESSDITGLCMDEGGLELIASPGPVFNAMIAALRGIYEGGGIVDLWKHVYRWFSGSEEWKERCNGIISGLTYSNQTGHLDLGKVLELYGSPMHASVSRLESYSACPFSFYIKYGLSAQERKIFRLEAVDVGSFMHNVIDEFSRLLVEMDISWRSLEEEWCIVQISLIVDRMLEKASGSVLGSSQRYVYLSGRLKKIVTRAVLMIAEHMRRSGFEPIGYEVEFTEGGRYPPIILKLPSGVEMSLTGRIDRIDSMTNEDGTYLRIIDYKSGSKALKLSDIYYGLQLQLLTYMDAVLENPEEERLLPGGVLYFKLDDPVVNGDRNSTEEDIERAIMKQLKMKGLLLADVKLVKEMDRQIDGDSLIIPARLNKGDVLGRSSAATAEQFDVLRSHIRKTLIKIGSEIINGNVAISPYKKRTGTACTFCLYSSVCQFDPSVRDNSYRFLNDIKDDEVWPLIRKNAGCERIAVEEDSDGREVAGN